MKATRKLRHSRWVVIAVVAVALAMGSFSAFADGGADKPEGPVLDPDGTSWGWSTTGYVANAAFTALNVLY